MASASSSPLEFTLSLKPAYVPTSLNNLFTDLADIDYVPRKLIVLNEYVRKHEEELAKVDQFKRDLPQCRLLLLDAIQVLKDEILKLSGQEEYSNACNQSDRRSAFRKYKSSSPPFNPKPRVKDQVTFQQGESRNGKTKERMVERETMSPTPFPCTVNRKASEPEPELALEEQRKQPLSLPERWTSYCKRRNWTPELHAGFLEATTLLGGPKEATPKQIREIMQVEGLTNDQVKSHLQKYRLHNGRRVPAAAAGNAPQQAPTRLIYRDFWNPSNTPQSNSNSQPPQHQEHEGGGRNGGGGSSSNGGWRSPENE